MCARQQGDLCNYRDKCDEDKGLYCDLEIGDGSTGICRGKDGGKGSHKLQRAYCLKFLSSAFT